MIPKESQIVPLCAWPWLSSLLALLTCIQDGNAQWILSGNEAKIDLDSGAPVVMATQETDSISLLDFSVFPPRVQHFMDIPNTVIGPPSNIAISPDGQRVIIANSLKLDPTASSGWVPANKAHLMGLSEDGLKPMGQIQTGLQPSGASFTPDGRYALIANRAGGSITVLEWPTMPGGQMGQAVSRGEVEVCPPEESLSDVAIAPDGSLVLASMQQGGYLAELHLVDGQLAPSGRKYSVYGQPYRVVISPDGRYGITAGAGSGDPLDPDALTLIDLKASTPVVVDHITLDPVTESLEISPDGKWIAAVCMAGSNLPPGDPHRSDHGSLVILKRDRKGFSVSQRLPTGRIPEGVAFTADGRYIAVQCHPSREIWIYRLRGSRFRDTGHRVVTPGFPSSMRAVIP
jgi:DNA-binding beta-propeller fold protein YncE